MPSRRRPMVLDPATAAHWRAGDGLAFCLSRSSRSYALLLAALAARGVTEPTIWVPAYYCGPVLTDLRQSRARLVFYEITDTLEPDWEDCARLARETPPDVFILTHFFGTESPAAPARAFADAHGAWLFEDAVHVMLPVGEIGKLCDFATYGPRKFFDAPDGGLLVVPNPELAEIVRRAASTLPATASPTLRWRLSRLRPPGRPRRGPERPMDMDDEFEGQQVGGPLWMSALTGRLLREAGQSGRFAAIAAPRLDAQRKTEAALEGWMGLRPVVMAPGAVPYFHAMRGPDRQTTQAALDALRAAGAQVAPWPAMPPEAKANRSRFAATWQVRRTLLRFSPKPTRHRQPTDFLSAPVAPWRDARPAQVGASPERTT